jgi:hypothetical protein
MARSSAAPALAPGVCIRPSPRRAVLGLSRSSTRRRCIHHRVSDQDVKRHFLRRRLDLELADNGLPQVDHEDRLVLLERALGKRQGPPPGRTESAIGEVAPDRRPDCLVGIWARNRQRSDNVERESPQGHGPCRARPILRRERRVVLRVGQSDPPIRRCYQWRVALGSIVVVIQPPDGVLRSLRDTAPRGANGDRTLGRPRRYPSGGWRSRRKGGRVACEDTAPVSVASPTVR